MSQDASRTETVEVFTQPHCAPCRQVEAWLRDRGIPFVLRDVDEDPAALEELVSRGYMTTPVTRIGDTWVAGYQRSALAAALAKRGA